MSRPKIHPLYRKCELCGKEIKNYPQNRPNRYCIECRDTVMKLWTSVPFEERIKILSSLGALRKRGIIQ